VRILRFDHIVLCVADVRRSIGFSRSSQVPASGRAPPERSSRSASATPTATSWRSATCCRASHDLQRPGDRYPHGPETL